jgi:hypothetical protein
VNVLDFGADPTGVVDSKPAIQAAVNSLGTLGMIFVPKGTYLLNSDVSTVGKAVSASISPDATFTGIGNINNPSFGYGFYYDGQTKDTKLSLIKSDNKTAATATFVKYSTKGDSGSFQNPSLYGLGYKSSTESSSRVQGVFGEAIDIVGGAGSFVEGGRFHGICNLASANQNGLYGTISKGQSGSPGILTSSSFVIGAEAEVISFNTGGNAPVPRSFNTARFNATFLSTVRYGDIIDAAFLVNPYNDISSQAGFVVAKSIGAQKTVKTTAFACYETSITYGIDLAKGSYTYAAIAIPNNSPIRAFDSSGANELNILYLAPDNYTALGIETLGVKTKSVFPNADLTFELGGGSNRWNNVWTKAVTLNTGASFTSGTGSPEGVVSAFVGSVYLNTSGGASTTLYIKTSGGSGNTGWTAK